MFNICRPTWLFISVQCQLSKLGDCFLIRLILLASLVTCEIAYQSGVMALCFFSDSQTPDLRLTRSYCYLKQDMFLKTRIIFLRYL